MTAATSASMREDILHDRKTEIDYINNYIVKLCRKHNIATPFNELLVPLINFKENIKSDNCQPKVLLLLDLGIYDG